MGRSIAASCLACFVLGSMAIAIGQAQTAAFAPASRPGIWISSDELSRLPTTGPAWEALLTQARKPIRMPDLADQNDPENVRVLARALVFARTGEPKFRSEVVRALEDVQGTEDRASALAISRELMAYVLSADLIGLEGAERAQFEHWLRSFRDRQFKGRSIRSTHEDRPNNWGTHAGATRIAIAIYLGEDEEITRAAHVFRGWLGDAEGWQGFEFGDVDWQATSLRPYAVNPPGSMLRGHSVDGVLPDDQRRGGGFEWPPPKENYVYEALQGAVAQAVLLERQGYPTWEWGDRGIERAFDWLHAEADFPAVGDDTWLPHIVNRAYGRDFPAPIPTQPGKGMGFAEWTHAKPSDVNSAHPDG